MSDFEIKKALLTQAFPELKNDLLEPLAKAATLKTYPGGSVLCHEDHFEDIFYIVQSGEVEFSKRMGISDHILRTGRAGEFFGEMALLSEGIGRSATVKATRQTTVLEIDRNTFKELIHLAPDLVLTLTKIVIQRMRQNDRQTIAQLQAQNRQIEQAYADLQKLDQQRHIFLTTLAHELRTPLTSVIGYMQLVRGGHMTGAGLQMSLEKIGSGLDRMVSLINDLFFLQEMDILDPRFKKVNMGEILEEVIDKCRFKAENQKVNLYLTLAPNLPPLLGETDGLLRAFWHLVDNAIKFSPNGGDVLIHVQTETEAILKIEVTDHGIGIDPNFLPRIFERFVRDENYNGHLFDGAGLGMPIVKQIIDLHQGSIEIDSVRGFGTTVRIRLPLDARRSTVELSIDDAWVDLPE